MKNTGVDVYALDLAVESEEGESYGSVIEFVWLDATSLARRIYECCWFQVVDIEYGTSNLVHDFGRLLLGGECFDGDFASDEGNDIGDRVWLQEAVDRWHEFLKDDFLLPLSVEDGLMFWEGDSNVVFTKVKCSEDHDEGGRQVWGRSGIVLSVGTSLMTDIVEWVGDMVGSV